MSNHIEFPELLPATKAALVAAYKVEFSWHDAPKEKWRESNRKGQAVFLRELMKHACDCSTFRAAWAMLENIADNLHNPPPPPPTLAQAREADLNTPEGQAMVHAFLATLGDKP